MRTKSHLDRSVRIISIVVVVGGMLLLAACENSERMAQSQTIANVSNPSMEPFMEQQPVEISMFVDFPGWPIPYWSGDIPEEITRRTGVKLNITVATDDRDLPKLIASDHLPELVFTNKELSRLANNKMSWDWNSLIKQYAPDFKMDKNKIALNTQTNGNFYTILSGHSNPDEIQQIPWVLPDGPGLAIRQDLMQQLGNPPLNSLEDLEDILRRVKLEWPEMIPLVSDDVKSFDYLHAQFAQVGTNNEFYKDVNGNLGYYIKQPGKLDFYTYVNKLYREGFLSAENFTYEDGGKEAHRLVVSGKAFAIMSTVSIADSINESLAATNMKGRMRMVTNPLSSKVQYYNYSSGKAGVFITQKNKHLKESIRFMQFMFSLEGQRLSEWGIEGKDWTFSAKGYPVFDENTQLSDYQKRQGIYGWGNLSASAVVQGLKNYSPTLLATPVREEIKKHTTYDPAMGMLNPPAYSDEKTIQTRLVSMVTNEQLNIYLAKSEEEVMNAYNNMLKKAAAIGLQKYEFWANKQYQQALGKLGEP